MREALKQLRTRHNLIGAEIGVFRASYALICLENLDIKRIYLIDLYKAYEGYDRYTPKELKEAEEIAHAKLILYKNKIRWIKAKSAVAVGNFSDESLDFVYINGNHTYQAVLEDITLYYPKVKRGGMLCGHDYRPPDKECVFDAVNEFCDKHNLKFETVGYEWWIWK